MSTPIWEMVRKGRNAATYKTYACHNLTRFGGRGCLLLVEPVETQGNAKVRVLPLKGRPGLVVAAAA